MKFYQSTFNYDYSFPAVSLAYFLRYPNPYSRHVVSTDVIDRHVDPVTHRLHTTRLHLKKSKVPAAALKFLPKGLAGQGGSSQSYVLERSIIDAEEGWMETESRNMDWTGVLSVVEHQVYKRQPVSADTGPNIPLAIETETKPAKDESRTSCKTTVTFVSRIGQSVKASQHKKLESAESSGDEVAPKQGFFASWSSAGIQRTVELIGVKRTKQALTNGKEGMTVVLERLRSGGIVGVLEGMRKDSIEVFGPEGPWKKAWLKSTHNEDSHQPTPDVD